MSSTDISAVAQRQCSPLLETVTIGEMLTEEDEAVKKVAQP